MEIKNRIKELRNVKASELLPNPKNWRQHPTSQLNALKGSLAEVGWVDTVLARETPNGLMLIDGHARVETAPDQEIPVLILDVTEAEADLILATHDPLTNMAGTDSAKLEELLSELSPKSDALQAMLLELSTDNGAFEVAESSFPELPSGDRTTPCSMNFTLSQDQVGIVKQAIHKAKALGPFVDTGNENGNGNCLSRICEVFLGIS